MPGRAWGRAYGRTQLTGGVLILSISWRGKRTHWEKGTTAFILPEYDIYGDVTLHMPSTGNLVWHVWCHVPGNAVCRKLPTDAFQPVTAKPQASKGHNQGQWSWWPVHWYFQCTKVRAYRFTVTHVVEKYFSAKLTLLSKIPKKQHPNYTDH